MLRPFSFLGMCPGGEEAVLKTVGSNDLAGSNPVHSVVVRLRISGNQQKVKCAITDSLDSLDLGSCWRLCGQQLAVLDLDCRRYCSPRWLSVNKCRLVVGILPQKRNRLRKVTEWLGDSLERSCVERRCEFDSRAFRNCKERANREWESQRTNKHEGR